MSTLTLQLSDEPVVTLPADLAQRAGLQEGTTLEATVSAEGLELRPAGLEPAAYAVGWIARREKLRERAIALGLYQPDRRDEEYWQIVTPLLQELDHELT